jgi:hypothetical protein
MSGEPHASKGFLKDEWRVAYMKDSAKIVSISKNEK